MSATLTIFTPTYNRASLLPRGFEALKKQSCKDFIWLIVDDGSTDDTARVVSTFQQEDCGFEIRYIKKENGGLHTGYNAAIEAMDTELAMCIDSDDWVAEGAVEKLLTLWQQIRKEGCAGIVALDAFPSGKPTCTIDGSGYINLNYYDTHRKWAGDRKLMVRTELYKAAAPMLSFGNEKNFNPQYMHYRIARDHTFYIMNEVVCIVDYQEAGMSAGIFRQFINSPNSFAEFRRMQMTMRPNSPKFILKSALHYDSSCILAGKPGMAVKNSPYPWLTAPLLPLGWLLAQYIRHKV